MTTNRRRFLAGTATAAAGLTLATFGRASPSADDWRAAFATARARHPWLLGFESVASADLAADSLRIEGRIPEALTGTLYRNGPARHDVFGYRYHHWFDGDGMVHAFRIGNGRVSHRGRLVATQKLLAEEDAGRALYPTFASVPPDPRPVTGPDSINVANISVLAHHGALYALWEAGSPHALDPETLATRGIHAFTPETRGLPFSAHPRVEPDGTLWNFGYSSGAGLLVLWHIDAGGALQRIATVPAAPMTMPHDFLVTAKHIVILLPPLHFEPVPGASFLDSHRWHPELPTRVLVVDKNDFSRFDWYDLPAQWVFHYGNAWEDDAGVIRFDGARAASPMPSLEGFRSVMRGEAPALDGNRYSTYRIDTGRRRIAEEPILDERWSSEFPTIDPRIGTRQHRRVVVLAADRTRPAPHPFFSHVSLMDVASGRLESYRYADHCIPEEHLFVPAPGSTPETQGWLVGTFLDVDKQATCLNVFDAESLPLGPIATVTLPYHLPLGLHGKFVEA